MPYNSGYGRDYRGGKYNCHHDGDTMVHICGNEYSWKSDAQPNRNGWDDDNHEYIRRESSDHNGSII
jgi:hypothetical protein